MITKKYTYQLNEIESVAKDLLSQFNSSIILFNGDMGAGKTTLIKALLKTMGSNEDVTSPTFSIVNEYETADKNVYHFDFYRIEDIEEAYNFGIEDYLLSNNWLFMEWAERIEDLLPEDFCIIDIVINNPKERTLKLTISNNNLNNNRYVLS